MILDAIGDLDIRIKPEWLQFFAAVAVLSIGIFVYLLDRPSSSVYFVPDSWSAEAWTPESWTMGNGTSSVFGSIGRYLPTFAHTFAFILFTTAVLVPTRRAALGICLGWLIVESLFEVAQSDALSAKIAGNVPAWFSDWPLLDNVAAYFLTGRFDPLDLVSIIISAGAAYLTFMYYTRRGSLDAD
jgi:hypothetical protein